MNIQTASPFPLTATRTLTGQLNQYAPSPETVLPTPSRVTDTAWLASTVDDISSQAEHVVTTFDDDGTPLGTLSLSSHLTDATLAPLATAVVDGVKPEVKRKRVRQAFGVRRADESYLAYTNRMDIRRANQAVLLAAKRAKLRNDIIDKAMASMDMHGICQDEAVRRAVGNLSACQIRDTGDARLLPQEYLPQPARATRVASDILASLTTKFGAFSSATGLRKMPKWETSEAAMLAITAEEVIYRNMHRAERSKANPLLNVRQIDRAEHLLHASRRLWEATSPQSPVVFTVSERRDTSKRSPKLTLSSVTPAFGSLPCAEIQRKPAKPTPMPKVATELRYIAQWSHLATAVIGSEVVGGVRYATCNTQPTAHVDADLIDGYRPGSNHFATPSQGQFGVVLRNHV